jgi:hypothetical protein
MDCTPGADGAAKDVTVVDLRATMGFLNLVKWKPC